MKPYIMVIGLMFNKGREYLTTQLCTLYTVKTDQSEI